jgi:hypothetical protein
MFRSALLAASVAAILPIGLSAADRWEDQVRAQMVGAVVGAAFNGYQMRHDLEVGSLRDGGTATFELNLREGVQYMLVAACDVDCDDVDLILRESNGRETVADRGLDDVAVIVIPAGHTGSHRVTVSMADCNANPCRYGLGLFTR